MLVRRDWMDNLGISDPESFQDFADMTIAFAKNDPDGNGIDDTLGYNVNSINALGKWVILGIAPECNVYSHKECKDCFAKLYCSGGCAANAYHTTGSVNGVYDFGCELHRKRIECAIMLKVAEAEQTELDAVVEEYMAMYPTRESMVQLAAATYGFDVATAEEYLSDYTDEELRTLMREQLVSAVKKKYADKAEAEIMQIIFEHSAPNDLFGTAGYAAVADIFDKTIANDTSVDKLAEYYDKFMPSKVSGTTLDEALEKLGAVDPDSPKTVNLYAATFEDKEAIADNIAEYNRNADEDKAIEYTDYVALLMSGVTTMIDAVSYGLIAFVAISLVVSSIMIGIITYISVLERTKEIGILRSIGASKRDISSVFNAETLIIGFCAGAIGIIASMLLCIPLNLIVRSLTGIDTLTAVLPWRAGIILVLISMVLTLIAGIIPSRIAAKKDPVAALRSE